MRVHVLYESQDLRTPNGASYIRLLQPLSHPANSERVRLTWASELTTEDVDVVVVDRMWRTDLNVDLQEGLLAELDRRGIPLIYSIDDDLLRSGLEAGKSGVLSLLQRNLIRRFMRVASGVLVSTAELARRLTAFNRRIFVLPNQLDERLFDEELPQSRPSGRVTFGYMGTPTHLEDLQVVLQPLRRFLSLFRDEVEFEIVGVAGPSELEQMFAGLPVRVRSVPGQSVSYPQFVKWLQREIHWDFAIAPLRESEFNSAKSDLKFLDYGVLGIPTICSDVDVYRCTVRNRETGLLATNSPHDWEEALRLLTKNATLRRRLARSVRSYVWQNRILSRHAGKWMDAIEEALGAGRNGAAEGRREFHSGAKHIGSGQKRRRYLAGNRQEKVLWYLKRDGRGLEIGPSFSPVAPKSEGWNAETLDHATAEELKAKYADAGVDTNRIEPVDYVWKGEPLSELTGRRDYYDYIIASNVIEHTPDLVGFLNECQLMLKRHGILSLVIPDCRYCFDVFRGFSTTGDVLQAHIENRNRHTPGTVFDHFALMAFLNGRPSWNPTAQGDLAFLNTFFEAQEMLLRSQSDKRYIDVHNWRFTPASFRLVVSDLRRLSLTSFSEKGRFGVDGCEFFVALEKEGISIDEDRLELAKLMRTEWSQFAPKLNPI